MAKIVWGHVDGVVSLSLLPRRYVMLEPMATVNRPSGRGSCEQDFVSEILSLVRVWLKFETSLFFFLS